MESSKPYTANAQGGVASQVDLARVAETLENPAGDLTGLADRLTGPVPRETVKRDQTRPSACHVMRLGNAIDNFRTALTRLQAETQRFHRAIRWRLEPETAA